MALTGNHGRYLASSLYFWNTQVTLRHHAAQPPSFFT